MMAFLDEATAALRRAGKRVTDQRKLIIATLAEANERLDAEAVYQRVREADSSVSIATVYRTLNILEEAGLLQQRYLSREHDRKYFELPVDTVEHKQFQFTCNRCGAVIPFTTLHIARLKRELESTLGVRVENICSCVDGLCPECLANQHE